MIFHRLALAGALLALFFLAGCGGRHYLDEYEFADRTLAVTHFSAPAPELWTGGYQVEGESALEVAVSAGGRVAREVQARQARARMDSAAARLDLGDRLARRTAERASRYLGTRPVPERDRADYLLEVDIRRLGLDASGRAAATVVVGEAILLDARTGREIWHADVGGRERLTPGLFSSDLVEDVVTAGALGTIDVDDFERYLAAMTDHVADRIADELRHDLRGARRR